MAERRPLEGLSVCYVSTGGFSGVTRTLKQATTLEAAGASVVFATYDGRMPEEYVGRFRCVTVPFDDEWASENPIWLARVARNLTINRLHNGRLRQLRERRLVDAVVGTGASVVQAVDLPVLDIAARAAKRLGARLVYDSHEYWPGFLANPDMGADAAWAEQLLAVEDRRIRDADLVLAVSQPMAERMAARYDMREPMVVFNAPEFKRDSALPVHDPVRLVFHGGLSADRNLEGLIRAVAYLVPLVTLDIHGFSRTVTQESLQELVAELGLQNTVRLHGPFEYEDVEAVISDYDVGVMTAKIVEENFEIALPNKLFDCMCAGLAVAMNDSEAVSGILAEVPFGIVLDPTTPETIAHDLRPLIESRETIMEMKTTAIEAAPDYWWPAQGANLVEVLETMM